MERDRLARALADDESFTLGQVPTGDGSAPGKTITPTNLDDPPAQAPLQRCMLVVEAVDNGAGLPEHVMTSGKLFTPFARLQQGDACLRMSSTGLGLAIVKSMVVTDLGGAVGVASKHGQGACFFALIPCWGRLSSEAVRGPGPGQGQGAARCGLPRLLEEPSAAGRARAPGWVPVQCPPQQDPQEVGPTHRQAASLPTTPKLHAGDVGGGLTAEELAGVVGRAAGGRATRALSVAESNSTTRKSSMSRGERESRRAARNASRVASSQRMALSPVARVGSMTGKPLCLVVDDDAISRSLTARLIRSFGLDATTLDDGEAFVQHLTAALKGTASASVRWPSVVCLDSSMPKLSGPAALAKLDDLATQLDSDGSVVEAARLRSLPIIGVTGNALAGDKARFIRAGARTVVVKPVDAPLLRGSLSACLGPLMPM